MTPAECKIALQDNLNDSLHPALRLQQLLAEERQALKQGDAESLHEIATHKQACVNKLSALDIAREEICRNSEFVDNSESIADLIKWCDDALSDASQDMSQTWLQFLEIAAACSGMNAANGAIIRVRQTQINAALSLLRDGTIDVKTYGPTGHNISDLGSRSLAEA